MTDNKEQCVAIYCRLAHEDDDRIASQRLRLHEYAVQHGYTNCVEYIDNGASGITADRLALAQMNEDIRAGRIQLVLVLDVARLFRDFILLGEWLDEVRSQGLSVISVQDGPLDDMLLPFQQNRKNKEMSSTD